MAGIIGTGLSYQQNAMSGMIRESAEQQKIDEANNQIKAQETMNTEKMIGEAFGVGSMLLFAALL